MIRQRRAPGLKPTDSWERARFTLGIVALTAACWLAAALLRLGDWAAVWGGFIPGRLPLGNDGSLAHFWLTPLTAILVHRTLIQLGFNLLILAFCGRRVENVLGPAGLVAIYVLGACAAAGARYLADPHSLVPMIGAGGAVSAVLGAYAMLYARNRIGRIGGRLAVWLNALWLLAAWLILQLMVGIAAAPAGLFDGQGMAFAAAAQIGGFLIGLLLANPLLLFRYRKA